MESERFEVILRQLGDRKSWTDKYFHWDELRFRPLPTGLNAEEWWFLIKWRRRSLFQPLPLKARDGQPFNWVPWPSITEALHRIDLGLGGIIQMPEPVTNPASRDRYLVRSLIEEAITSSQLEGAVATREVAKQMIRSQRPPRDKSEQMILNNYHTMRQIRERKDEPLTPKLVKDLHRIITEKTLEKTGAAGRFRRQNEKVVVDDYYGNIFHEPPSASELSARMAAMCDFANSRSPDHFIHPVLRAIILHFWLAYDHPFLDGNGRVARALFYWSMLRSGYWLCELISISHFILKAPAQYYRAFLHSETDDNDLTYFLIHQLELVRRAIDELHQYIDRQTRKMQALRAQLRGMDFLNHRQRALIEHALAHPDADYTIDGHQLSHNVVYQTARTDLLNLVERGLLDSRKIGRTIHFRPTPELESRLADLH